jgi:L-lactate dehydrogenase complex protein LldE
MSKKVVGLFIPCYINEIYPEVALATLTLLENIGFQVEYPLSQTCCGQPMANSGCASDTKVLARRFVDIFSGYDFVVAPSASCVSMVKNHYEPYVYDMPSYAKLQNSIFEICEFLHDIVKIDHLDVTFAHSVALHQSCHGLRELSLGVSRELAKPFASKALSLLQMVEDITIKTLSRPDECCGFGGTFCINEPDISTRMGQDKLDDAMSTQVEYLVGFDSSCLMHLEGIAKRENRDIKMVHITQILSGQLS